MNWLKDVQASTLGGGDIKNGKKSTRKNLLYIYMYILHYIYIMQGNFDNDSTTDSSVERDMLSLTDEELVEKKLMKQKQRQEWIDSGRNPVFLTKKEKLRMEKREAREQAREQERLRQLGLDAAESAAFDRDAAVYRADLQQARFQSMRGETSEQAMKRALLASANPSSDSEGYDDTKPSRNLLDARRAHSNAAAAHAAAAYTARIDAKPKFRLVNPHAAADAAKSAASSASFRDAFSNVEAIIAQNKAANSAAGEEEEEEELQFFRPSRLANSAASAAEVVVAAPQQLVASEVSKDLSPLFANQSTETDIEAEKARALQRAEKHKVDPTKLFEQGGRKKTKSNKKSGRKLNRKSGKIGKKQNRKSNKIGRKINRKSSRKLNRKSSRKSRK